MTDATTPTRPPVEIAVDYLQAFGRGDMATAAQLLADDVTFESPRVKLTGVQPVLEAVGQFAQVVTGLEVVAALGDERSAMVMYDMETAPFGTLRAVDHLHVEAGRITSDVLVFDTYELRQAGAA